MAAKRCKKHKYQISVLVISMCYNEHKSKFCLPADYSTVCFKIDIAQGNQYSTFDVGCSMFDVLPEFPPCSILCMRYYGPDAAAAA
jgi:hypothetical protein